MSFKFTKFIAGLILLLVSIYLVKNGYSLFWIVLSFYGGMLYQSSGAVDKIVLL